MDEGPREAILLPSQWSLIARDAFNGTILWKRPIAEWNTQLWPLKSGPNQLPRRLVAVGDRVYVTLGIDAPLDGSRRRHRQDRSHLRRARTTPTRSSTPTARCSCWWPMVPNKWKELPPQVHLRLGQYQRANSEWAWDGEPAFDHGRRGRNAARCAGRRKRRVAPLTLGRRAQAAWSSTTARRSSP